LITSKSSLLIVASILLVLMLVIMSCTPSTGTTATVTTTVTATPKATTATTASEKTYRALNPLGTMPPVDIKPLAPRLDKLDGKTIWVIYAESDPVIMPAVWDRVRKEYPNTTWLLSASSATSYRAEQRLTAEQLKTANAAIMGVAF
jgi:hypothetical protein